MHEASCVCRDWIQNKRAGLLSEVQNGQMVGKGKFTWFEEETYALAEELEQEEDEEDEAFEERKKEAYQKAWEEDGLADLKYLDGEPMYRINKSDEEEDGYIYYNRKAVYEGDYELDPVNGIGERTGQGKMLYADGREYEGDFLTGYFRSPTDPLVDHG